ncbi:MAG: TrmH family RNA methyltransferase [Chloroflexota bacterium]|nr:TrmH family RNA methyltransferase [Chloroflexota bacterium]MDQ5866608.1 TrmH family RNA methyltransferase [Chloroflexota bacterium]
MDVPLKPYKRDFDHSYSLGVFPTLELVEAQPGHVLQVLVSSKGERNEGVRKLERLCARAGIRLETNDRAIERLAQKENTFAVGVFRKYAADLQPTSNHVVLVNPSDMGNLGTIARTMLGFSMFDLAIVQPAADMFDPKVVRASMGAIFRLRCRYFDTFEQYRETAGERSLYPFMTGGDLLLHQVRFSPPFTLIFGNESSGLPPEYRDTGTPVTIKHTGAIDSLNLPMSVGIALYEATRGAV